MIAQLTGKLAHKQPNSIIIDVGGVGYEVIVPLSTFYELGDPGSARTVTLSAARFASARLAPGAGPVR